MLRTALPGFSIALLQSGEGEDDDRIRGISLRQRTPFREGDRARKQLDPLRVGVNWKRRAVRRVIRVI